MTSRIGDRSRDLRVSSVPTTSAIKLTLSDDDAEKTEDRVVGVSLGNHTE